MFEGRKFSGCGAGHMQLMTADCLLETLADQQVRRRWFARFSLTTRFCRFSNQGDLLQDAA